MIDSLSLSVYGVCSAGTWQADLFYERLHHPEHQEHAGGGDGQRDPDTAFAGAYRLHVRIAARVRPQVADVDRAAHETDQEQTSEQRLRIA